ncbi:MAG TPA: hypothetical protein VFN80_02520, partial [Acidothermaceae bacterium]|nr:hypothetical protein [Acidothermaceae bacterium]
MRGWTRMGALAASFAVAASFTAVGETAAAAVAAAPVAEVAAAPVADVAYSAPAPASGYAADSLIGVVGVDGSADHVLSTAEPAAEPAWNPTGTLVAFTALLPGGATAVHVIDPATGAERAVTPTGWRTPVWSPDGAQLAVVSGAGATADLGVVSAAGGDPTVLIAWNDHGGDDAVTGRPAWSPDGSRLAAMLTEYSAGVPTAAEVAVLGADRPGYSAVGYEYGKPVVTGRQVVW